MAFKTTQILHVSCRALFYAAAWFGVREAHGYEFDKIKYDRGIDAVGNAVLWSQASPAVWPLYVIGALHLHHTDILEVSRACPTPHIGTKQPCF